MVVTFEFDARVRVPDADRMATVDEMKNVLQDILEDAIGGEAEVRVYYLEAEE